ncbi:MAG: methyltransferase domain-containing protein [Deltaproteobacteria bacterium]|nr:methyltransferase domain-containing protein [Deltaproteobacteria bacterium]
MDRKIEPDLGSKASTASGEQDFTVTLSNTTAESIPQDEEQCIVRIQGHKQTLRFHDYDLIYPVPGLYEHIFYELLGCRSPQWVGRMLSNEWEREGVNPATLKVLDVGAGNGMMGEVLRKAGVRRIVGTDILPEARNAALRDRPGVYEEYIAGDLTQLTPEVEERLQNYRFDAMTLVAALGFGDIPPEVFLSAYNLVSNGGWVAFNIKEDFMEDRIHGPFARLLRHMQDTRGFEVLMHSNYIHRRSVTGEPLRYNAFVGRKRCDIAMEALGN